MLHVRSGGASLPPTAGLGRGEDEALTVNAHAGGFVAQAFTRCVGESVPWVSSQQRGVQSCEHCPPSSVLSGAAVDAAEQEVVFGCAVNQTLATRRQLFDLSARALSEPVRRIDRRIWGEAAPVSERDCL